MPIREWRCQDIDQVLLHEIILFPVYLAAVKCFAKMLPLANMLYVKSDCGTTDKTFTVSLQYSSRVEALNLIVESKSLLVKLNNSTIELQVPSKRKKSLQSYCSVDFDFLAFDMTLDVTSRNGSSFSKHTNSCY